MASNRRIRAARLARVGSFVYRSAFFSTSFETTSSFFCSSPCTLIAPPPPHAVVFVVSRPATRAAARGANRAAAVTARRACVGAQRGSVDASARVDDGEGRLCTSSSSLRTRTASRYDGDDERKNDDAS
jgi:hypothetical protein